MFHLGYHSPLWKTEAIRDSGGTVSVSFDGHCCHVATAVMHPAPDRVKPLFVSIGGATPKFLGGPNLRPTTDFLQAIYGLAYNSQHWDWGQTEILCDVCKIQ